MRNQSLVVLLVLCSFQMLEGQKVMNLDAFRELAVKHNKSVEIATENVNAARELKRAAFTQFLPNFMANGTYAWNEKNLSLLAEDAMLPVGSKMADGTFGFTPDQVKGTTLPNGQWVPVDASGTPFNPAKNPEKIQWKGYALLPKEAMEFDIHNVFVGSVGFFQPVFMGGKILELNKMATYGQNLAKAQKDNKISDLIMEVDEAYWRVVSLENKVKLASEFRNLVAQLDSNVRIMTHEGVATKADQLKVRVKLNEAEMTLARAENGLNLSKMALYQLCGISMDEIYLLDDEDLKKDEVANVISTDQALRNRSEVMALTQLENLAKSNERIMFSRFLPTIALTGNYVVSNPNMFNGYRNEFAGMFNVGVVASVPLFHFGDRLHTLNAAKSQHKIASLQLEEAKEKIQLQIKQNSYKLSESVRKKNASLQNIEAAEENLRFATEGFNAGVISSTDLMTAQTTWLSAMSENIDSIIEFKLCNTYLNKSLGLLALKNE